jgi:hypothetical protein
VTRGDTDLNIALGLRKTLKPIRQRHRAALTAPKDVANLMVRIEDYPGSAVVRFMVSALYLSKTR